MSTARSGGGFWLGMLTGFAVAAVLAVVLALAFPPIPVTPPALAPEAARAPVAPGAPEPAAPAPSAPETRALVRGDGPAPLVPDRQGVELSPDLPGLAPPVAPDRFEGEASGSPSLVPPDGAVTLRPVLVED